MPAIWLPLLDFVAFIINENVRSSILTNLLNIHAISSIRSNVHTHTHTHIHTHTHTCIHTYTHNVTYIQTYIHTRGVGVYKQKQYKLAEKDITRLIASFYVDRTLCRLHACIISIALLQKNVRAMTSRYTRTNSTLATCMYEVYLEKFNLSEIFLVAMFSELQDQFCSLSIIDSSVDRDTTASTYICTRRSHHTVHNAGKKRNKWNTKLKHRRTCWELKGEQMHKNSEASFSTDHILIKIYRCMNICGANGYA